MPDFAAAAATIGSRFQTQFHAARPDVPIAFDNVEGLYKSNGQVVQEARDSNGNPIPWVRLNQRPGDAFQVSLGGKPYWRHPGEIIVEIYTVAGSGYQLHNQIAEDVASAFRGITDSGVRFEAPSAPQYVGPEGAWFHTNVRLAYEFDLVA